jgi:hypothetical protein
MLFTIVIGVLFSVAVVAFVALLVKRSPKPPASQVCGLGFEVTHRTRAHV